MYNEQQIEDMKRRVREQDTKVFDIWLNQYDDTVNGKEIEYNPAWDME